MSARGFGDEQAEKLLHRVLSDPIFAGAQSISWRVRNLECLLDIQRTLAESNPKNQTIDRHKNLSEEEFFERYYSRNQPVIIEGLIEDWPARSKWSPQYFSQNFGQFLVEVQANRKTDPVYEVFLKGHSRKMKLSEFCSLVEDERETNSFYLTANDRLLENDNFRSLCDDFWPLPQFFRERDREEKQFLWFGPKGAVSPLHRDRLNVFMTQVFGRKRVKMISSQALHLVYNYESFFSEVDVENPDLEKYPLFAQVNVMDVELNPGDCLLIPVGWWHHVRALTVSINVSLTNFKFGNDFRRFYDRGI